MLDNKNKIVAWLNEKKQKTQEILDYLGIKTEDFEYYSGCLDINYRDDKWAYYNSPREGSWITFAQHSGSCDVLETNEFLVLEEREGEYSTIIGLALLSKENEVQIEELPGGEINSISFTQKGT